MKRKSVTALSLVFLTFIICCIAYFQYSNSKTITHSTSNNQKSKTKDIIPVIFPKPFEFHEPKKNEKFLAYLPHSGFHNQRIELENALLLAKYLGRTLIIPPVYLASPAMPWLQFGKLHERMLYQNKNALDHCQKLDAQQLPLPSECLNYFRWSNVPWTFFYDLSNIDQPVIFRPGLDFQWIYSTLKTKHSDIYFFKDLTPYEYQISDDSKVEPPLERFNYRMSLKSLKEIKHRVLHFGSMFGSYRVLAESPEHMEMLRTIRKNMIFNNPVLSKAAKNVVKQLGGPNNFVGLHVRVGDGIFKLRASILVDDIYHKLVDKFTDLTLEEVKFYEGGVEQHDLDRTESTEYSMILRDFHPVSEDGYSKPVEVDHSKAITQFDFDPKIASRLKCSPSDATTNLFRNTVVYIATDAPDPRNHPLLRKLFNVFPCTFILSDFMDELDNVKKLSVKEESVNLESYLIPLVDAMISAHGHTFMGTPHSTFTSYIERQLHPFYTGKQVQVMSQADFLKLTKK